MQEPYVTYSIHNKIATVEFYTPQHNSLPTIILQQLADTITQAGNDDNCKVIILKSAGNKTFCAGASFDELMSIENEEQGLIFFSGFAKVINAIRQCPQFIIGSVQGKAIGGGVGLACSCDYTLATVHAQIKLSELAVGIGPFVVGPAVERKIGNAAAYELAIDASNFRSAEWAMQKGLYVNIFSSIEELEGAVEALATTLSNYNADAMHEIKKAFWKGTENWDELLMQRAAISGKLILSDFSKKFLKEFKKK
ncbi:MAG: enoyl-CoA hydratase/isomerase family protein [Bacteroidetes bacterium]|nr:enoyl-CoA hydratase/isomerase family protein [Bacteroidota bacterium]MBS1649013.1 enoyl-CoA hydratase/isomerase family protein [Bacteroidota bacterium]